MIEINILPEELRKKKRQSSAIGVSKMSLRKLPLINMVAMAVGIILSTQLVLFVVGVITGMGCKALDKSYKEMLPKKKETENLKTQVGKMNKKVAAIDELMVKRFSWAKKLNDLSDSMTPGIWLTELKYDEKMGEMQLPAAPKSLKKKGTGENIPTTVKVVLRYLKISGMASSMGEEGTALIGRFIKNLKADNEFYSDFSDIELGTITREKMEDQEVMKFNITCPFKIK